MDITINDTVRLGNYDTDGWFVDGVVSGIEGESVDVDFGDMIVRYFHGDFVEHVEYYTQSRMLTPTVEGTIVTDFRSDDFSTVFADSRSTVDPEIKLGF